MIAHINYVPPGVGRLGATPPCSELGWNGLLAAVRGALHRDQHSRALLLDLTALGLDWEAHPDASGLPSAANAMPDSLSAEWSRLLARLPPIEGTPARALRCEEAWVASNVVQDPSTTATAMHDRQAASKQCRATERKLTTTERKLLQTLCQTPNRVCSRPELLRGVWGTSGREHTRTVDTHIKRLRHKLGGMSDCIETVRGVGYRYSAAATQLETLRSESLGQDGATPHAQVTV